VSQNVIQIQLRQGSIIAEVYFTASSNGKDTETMATELQDSTTQDLSTATGSIVIQIGSAIQNTLFPTPSPTSAAESSSSGGGGGDSAGSSGVIAGAVVGVVGGVAFIGGAVYLLHRRKQKNDDYRKKVL